MNTAIKRAAAFMSLFLFMGTAAFAQKIQVSGTVKDASTGEPVPGAAIMVKAGNGGVISDTDGRYSIQVSSDATIICTCIGFSDIEQPVNGRAIINFSLEIDAQMLEETVVVGYGTLKKSQLVGSVEQISGEALEDRANANVSRTLQGQVPGLSIIQSDGKPTHGGSIYIRGGATSYVMKKNLNSKDLAEYSIGQGGSALVLIDGVEGDISSVNPDDVESISVLKDASSSAIYGSRAAYGVILVTTKKASSEKVTLTYNGSFSINQRTVMWEDHIISDGLEFTRNFYDFYLGKTETPTAAGALPDKMNTYKIPDNYLELFEARRAAGNTDVYDMNGNDYLYFGSVNYFELFYKRRNTTRSHSMSVNGSSGKMSYSLSGRYYTQDGIYKIGNEDYNQYNLRSKVTLKLRDWMSIDNNTYLYRVNYIQPIFSKNSDKVGSQVQQIAVIGLPVLPVTNEDGTYTLGGAASGYAAFNDGNSSQDSTTSTVITTTGINIEPIKDVLKFRGDVSYKFTSRVVERYVAPTPQSLSPGIITYYVSEADSYKKEYRYDTNHLSANLVGTFTPKLGPDHKLNVVAGWNLEDHKYDIETILRHGMLYPGLPSFELFNGSEIEIKQYDSDWSTIGTFARANYTLLGRYILEGSLRYDMNSRFPSNQRGGWFPSASAGWRISEEPWMKGTRGVIDNLKLRGNWGSLGNGGVSPYSFLETMGLAQSSVIFDGGYASVAGMPSIVPDSLTWEKIRTMDIGLDLDILKSRLSFSGDYYVRFTDEMYSTGPELPAILGASTPKGNYGQLTTKGWEATLSWRDSFKVAGKDLTYSIKGSLWDSRTWVTEFYSETNNIFDYYEGKELGELWGFRTDGLFTSNEEAAAWFPDRYHNLLTSTVPYAGDIRFLDLDDNKEITAGAGTLEDHGDLDIIGNIMPRYQYGINFDMKWNGIGLSVFLQGIGHRDWYPSEGTSLFWGGYERAYNFALKCQQTDRAILDKSTENWVVTNASENPYWPRRLYGPAMAGSGVGTMNTYNDYFLQNAAYLRLKNLTVDYTLPSNVSKKLGLEKMRVYLSGENLLTFSPIYEHTDMFDPEVITKGDSDFGSGTSTTMGDGASYPMLKSYTIGINLTF
jgi:TonB-linked SusC/RagA family outer membrane protein